jgi:hypothetical protein
VLDIGASSHMKRMRLMFLSVSKKDLDCYVKSGMHTMHARRGLDASDSG